ncbi:MAG: GNAT family N-acetyltransferase [Trichocoleus desertorum ATA4-8-CV12]|jgi:GNAT superfamily N-acetyltransferase|nr:GNAT family N-acetyltransferase [Trichocoleus desertorum ATA4-8-CV12]
MAVFAFPCVVRPAIAADIPTIFALIQALAEYEKLSHEVVGSPEALESHLFGDRPYAEAIMAEVAGQGVGFALFFHNYSTFLTQPGIYLEDLFVLPEYRGQGIGKAFLTYLAQLAVARNCGRLEWSVLDWNAPAIAFYERMGADVLPDWRTCRVTRQSLANLAAIAPVTPLPS